MYIINFVFTKIIIKFYFINICITTSTPIICAFMYFNVY